MTSLPPAALTALVHAHQYDAVAELLEKDRGAGHDRTRALADLTRRVLDLDAEDFTQLAAENPGPWTQALAHSAFPPTPKDRNRGALGSLVALYELMLEVIEVRAQRDEPLMVLVTLHIMSEYLQQLAWEPRLGHAGDPLRLRKDVGERWGTDDQACSHISPLRATARRALNACDGDQEPYDAYITRFHSRQGEALAVCAMNVRTSTVGDRPDTGPMCKDPCSWALRGSQEERSSLDARCRLAAMFATSSVVALRHHAPVGHFFGVPSMKEVRTAWHETSRKLAEPWRDGSNPLTISTRTGKPGAKEALPGLSRLISVIADAEIGPSHVVADLGEAITQSLDS